MIARNTLLNIVGLGVPLAVAFFVMPIAAEHLGAARFGLLGLAWAITEYLVLFDLGLGRATVKFVADAVHGDAHELSETVWLATLAQVVAGALGGFLFFMTARPIVDLAFDLPPDLFAEAVSMFEVVGLNLPAVLLVAALRSTLEGAQRFDLSSSLRIVGSSAAVIVPAIGAAFGASLPRILLWVLASRIVVSVIGLVAVRYALPMLTWRIPAHFDRLKRLLSFGGWVFVSSALSPILVYFDRFALAASAGVAAAGFYTAPYEGVTRLLLLPAALVGSLFPAFTALEKTSDRTSLTELMSSSVRTLMVLMVPPLAIVAAFAPKLLLLWLGAEYADHATMALRIMSAGVLINALAHPLFISLYAMDRPDLPAKFHLIELAIHIPLTIMLIRSYGIAGAASAWTARVIIDFLLLLAGTSRTTALSVTEVAGGHLGRVVPAALALLGLLWCAATLSATQSVLAATLSLVSIIAFAAVSWRWILHNRERTALSRLLHLG